MRLSLLLPLIALFATPAIAQERPDTITLAENENWDWAGSAGVTLDWNGDQPVMTGTTCTLTYGRFGSNNEDVVAIRMAHPVESSEITYRFDFALPDQDDLIDRRVESITVGGRPYFIDNRQVRMIPWVGETRDIILSYGIARQMARPGDDYPWLPLEFLLPRMFEVEGIQLGISGAYEIEHGEYERQYDQLYLHTGDFREAMEWCQRRLIPNHEFVGELAQQLGERLAQ